MTYGQCIVCGAIAWELLDGTSAACLGCDPESYRDPDEWDYDDDDDDDEDEGYRKLLGGEEEAGDELGLGEDEEEAAA